MRPRSKPFTMMLSVLLGAVVGASFGLAVVPESFRNRADAHLDMSSWYHTWPYTFSASSCWNNSETDPIQIVYYNVATISNVNIHSAHHDGWSVSENETSPQYFYDHYCGRQDGQNADADFTSSRYHQRLWYYYDYANGWNTYSLATPHYEDVVWPECSWKELPHHAVRENGSSSMPEGGFIKAKHRIDQYWHNWSPNGWHYWWGYQDWRNTQWFKQCDDQYAWGNGLVDFIRINGAGH